MGTPAMTLLGLMNGCRVTQTLYVAAKLGIPDLLQDGPRASEELAGATGADARALRRLLRALVSLGVFAEETHGRFALTELGALLRSDVPGSLRAAAIFLADERNWRAWGALERSVMNGEPVRGPRGTQAFLEESARDPEGAALFNAAMTSLTSAFDTAVTAGYDFSRFGTVVDVGGGQGALISSILAANPTLRGILFDIPPVIESARACIAEAGLAERCALVAGDCFASVPAGGDAYVLKWVIHDWDDERATTILRNCHRAMARDGRLLLVERVVPERIDQSAATQGMLLGDLNMLLVTGGRERTAAEYRTLLGGAGFALARIVPTATPLSVIEATRA
jgi:O-methyltransferase domain/Dimerisation domain